MKEIIKYIEEVYFIFGKEIPNFNSLSSEEIFKLYSEINFEIKNKLIKHRHKPVKAEILFKLDEVKNLPKNLKYLLNGMTFWSEPKIIYPNK